MRPRSGFDSQYAPNPQRYIPANSVWLEIQVTYIASSRHPGGVNRGFAGRLRQVYQGFDQRLAQQCNAAAIRKLWCPDGLLYHEQHHDRFHERAPIGVWQAITTRNWGEVVSSTSIDPQTKNAGAGGLTTPSGPTADFTVPLEFRCHVTRSELRFLIEETTTVPTVDRARVGRAALVAAAGAILVRQWSLQAGAGS